MELRRSLKWNTTPNESSMESKFFGDLPIVWKVYIQDIGQVAFDDVELNLELIHLQQ